MTLKFGTWWQKSKLHSWWEKVRHYWIAIGVITIVLAVVIALIITVVWFYGTGFNGYNKVSITRTISGPSTGTVTSTEEYQPGKTLWDWLSLFIAPLSLGLVAAVIAYRLNSLQQERDAKSQLDRFREEALQKYFDDMTELMLKDGLTVLTPLIVSRISLVTAHLRCFVG